MGCAYQQGVSHYHRHPWTQCLQGPQRKASGAGGAGCPIDAAPQSAQSAWRLYSIDTNQIRCCGLVYQTDAVLRSRLCRADAGLLALAGKEGMLHTYQLVQLLC